jgi:hypothetical protein
VSTEGSSGFSSSNSKGKKVIVGVKGMGYVLTVTGTEVEMQPLKFVAVT